MQDITPSDILAEGIELPEPQGCDPSPPPDGFETWAKERQDEWFEGMARTVHFCRCNDVDVCVKAWIALWDSINAKKCPWESNPWVWVSEWGDYVREPGREMRK